MKARSWSAVLLLILVLLSTGPGETLRNAFRNLVGFLQWIVDVLIVVVVNGIPIALVLLIPILLLRKAWRRWGKRPAEPAV
jgi:hypothetical protein